MATEPTREIWVPTQNVPLGDIPVEWVFVQSLLSVIAEASEDVHSEEFLAFQLLGKEGSMPKVCTKMCE